MWKPARSGFIALALSLSVACASPDEGVDGGGDPVDSSVVRDTGSSGDANVSGDGGGGGCGAGEHDCDGVCTEDGFNDPATGCRLGCGEPCPGTTMALCNADGTCGIRGCDPMTCEEQAVECGLADDGCGTRRNCGSCDAAAGLRCESGACVCTPDAGEPGNDSRTGLTSVTSIDDSVEPPPFPLEGTLHVDSDEDWYQVAIVDGSDGGSPVLRVELVTAPAGSDYEIAAYFACTDTSGTNTTSCTSGSNDDSVAQGCTTAGLGSDLIVMDTSCGGLFTDENGTLWVRVRAASWGGTCGEYTVRVSGS
jgi:hypothetical protein